MSTSRKRRKHPPSRGHSSAGGGCARSLLRAGAKLGILVILLWFVVGLGFYAWSLRYDLRTISGMPQRSVVLDRNGALYSRLEGENRIVIPFDRVSNDFVNALLAREDTRFYSHHGIDPIGIARAVVRNFVAGGFREGASTITQQLARNSFPLGGKTLQRKMLEAALAHRIETELTKEEILEAYMNRIYFGSGFYGVETASQAYFGKPASRMDLSESAMLAGLIRSPNRFSPFRSIEKAVRERDAVLRRMEEVGFITEQERAAAVAAKPRIAPGPRSSLQEDWAMEAIREELEIILDRPLLDAGGLRVECTIDPGLQAAAERSLSARLDAIEARPGFSHQRKAAFVGQDFAGAPGVPYLEGAALAMDAQTGAIRAIVGGRDREASRFNRAFHGRRQIGSAVKPFVFAAALENGLRPRDRISDARLTAADIPAKFGRYDPANADGTYGRELPAEEGLVHSRNTMTVRVGLIAGLDRVADTVRKAGLSPDPPRYPALCLGAFEAGLKELTAAYAAFDNEGIRPQPYLIERVLDAKGHVLFRATRGSLRILTPRAASDTAEMLEEVIERGTGSSARRLGLRGRAGGKTGTTNDCRDAWFVGFSRGLSCGVWVGFDQPRSILEGGSGADLALPVWVDIMRAAR